MGLVQRTSLGNWTQAQAILWPRKRANKLGSKNKLRAEITASGRKWPKMKDILLTGTVKSRESLEPRIPDLVKKRSRAKKEVIIISDDEPDEQLGRMGDDWSLDNWDELVKEKPEHWDMRDAFKLGKRESLEDPSSNKKERPRAISPTIGSEQLKNNMAKLKQGKLDGSFFHMISCCQQRGGKKRAP